MHTGITYLKKYILSAGLEWQDRGGGGVPGAIDRAFALNQRNLWRSRPLRRTRGRKWVFSPPPCGVPRARALCPLLHRGTEWYQLLPLGSVGRRQKDSHGSERGLSCLLLHWCPHAWHRACPKVAPYVHWLKSLAMQGVTCTQYLWVERGRHLVRTVSYSRGGALGTEL